MVNYHAAIALIADEPAKVRRCDVFRLLDAFEADKRAVLARMLRTDRPDLAEEISDCLDELADTELEESGYYAGPSDADPGL